MVQAYLLQPQRMVLPEAVECRVLAAAEGLPANGLAKIILLSYFNTHFCSNGEAAWD